MIVSEIPLRVQAGLFVVDFWNTAYFWNTHRARIQKQASTPSLLRRIHSGPIPTDCFLVSRSIYLVYLIDSAVLIMISPGLHIGEERVICEQISSS